MMMNRIVIIISIRQTNMMIILLTMIIIIMIFCFVQCLTVLNANDLVQNHMVWKTFVYVHVHVFVCQ